MAVMATSVRADTPGIVGDWIVDNAAMGARQTFSFRSNGSYTYRIWRVMGGITKVVQEENGKTHG
jgi:hypothetical protein